MQKNECGYITIFHDYEGAYARPEKEEASYYGVNRLLDIEKQYNIKATYNVVSRLFNDYPETINRIINEGHDLASHSYAHKVITDLTKKQIDEDIKRSQGVFRKFGKRLQGYRTPQSRWSFALMRSMLDNGLKWSAENDRADFPYIILNKKTNKLFRLPIKMDDWDYIANNDTPAHMSKKLEAKAKEIESKKCYGAIGFHPWVQGESEERLSIFEGFIRKISDMPDIKIVTFDEMCLLAKKQIKYLYTT